MNKNEHRLLSTRVGSVVTPDKVANQNNVKQEHVKNPLRNQQQRHEAKHVTCLACIQPLPDGNKVTAYAVRPCPHSPWMVAQTRRRDHPLTLADRSTLGVDERVVSGRVDRVVDCAHQRSWPVTTGENIVASSPAHTTSAQEAQA